jgi:hypothetical protein
MATIPSKEKPNGRCDNVFRNHFKITTEGGF